MSLQSLILILNSLSSSRSRRTLFAMAALLFYLSCNEWCHCQRDTWMLLPVAGAVWIRSRRVVASFTASWWSKHGTLSCVAEGFSWGCAFWLKPHVAIPAGCLIAFHFASSRSWTHSWKEFVFIVAGGLLAAFPGIAWMILIWLSHPAPSPII